MASRYQSEADVIVIGGGLSGLTAAYHLLQNKPDCKVLVLEAKDRVGGRTLTVELQGSQGPDSWDLGGQWVCRSQHHVLWLMAQVGIHTKPQWTTGKKFMQLGDNKIRTYSSNIPSLPFFSLLELHFFMKKMEKIVKGVPRDDPRLACQAEELDNITLENLVCQHTWTKATRDAVEAAITVICGAKMRELSALYFLHYASTAGSLKYLLEAEDGAGQEWKVRAGAQNISRALVEQIGEQNVLLSEPVTLIDQSQSEFITVKTATGKYFNCKHVICASPVHCAAAITYKPKPPLTRIALANRMPVGHIFKFIVTYKTSFWREAGFSGEIVSSGGATTIPGCDSGPIQLVYDAGTASSSPALVGFYANPRQWGEVELLHLVPKCDYIQVVMGGLDYTSPPCTTCYARKQEAFKPEERKAAVLKSLVEFFGPEAGDPIDFAEKDWGLEPYNGGGPTNFMSPGAITLYFDGLRTPFDRIHWAGTETAARWCGFMNGAVQAGMRAAEEVLEKMGTDWEKTPSILKKLDNKGVAKTEEKGGRILYVTGTVLLCATVSLFVMKHFLK